jgi:hypothetical protein
MYEIKYHQGYFTRCKILRKIKEKIITSQNVWEYHTRYQPQCENPTDIYFPDVRHDIRPAIRQDLRPAIRQDLRPAIRQDIRLARFQTRSQTKSQTNHEASDS